MKKILSLILCAAMLISLLPAAYADETESEEISAEKIEEEINAPAEIIEPAAETADERAEEAENAMLTEESESEHFEASTAKSGTCGKNLRWVLDDEGTLTISGTGEMEYYAYRSSPWCERTDIRRVKINEGVTTLNNYVFDNCGNLEAVYFPENPPSFSSNAFSGCENLRELHVVSLESWLNSDAESPLSFEGGNLYVGDELITEVSIPKGTTTIGAQKFYNVTSINSVYIPDSVKVIGRGAFWGSGIEELYLPEGVTTIEINAFASCENLRSVSIPRSTATIGNYAFLGCNLKELYITSLESYLNISFDQYASPLGNSSGTRLFVNNRQITNLVIPDGIKTIPDAAFCGCFKIESVTIPDSVTELGRACFERCTLLTDIELPDSITQIGDWAFAECKSITEIKIPDSVVSIGEYCFASCENLETVKLSNKISVIPNQAFAVCGLKSIIIPEGVRKIGIWAFNYCDLFSIYLPTTIEKYGISSSAFEYLEIKTIFYGGSEADWENKYLGDAFDDSVSIHFNSRYGQHTFENGECIICGETGSNRGDINEDGTVNIKDAVALLKHVTGEDVAVAYYLLDTTGDGEVNLKDAVYLLKYVTGEAVTLY